MDSLFEPHTYNYKGKEPIMTKQMFHFTCFCLNTRFQGTGFRVYLHFCWVYIAFVYNLLVEYFVFIYTYQVWVNLSLFREFLRLFLFIHGLSSVHVSFI